MNNVRRQTGLPMEYLASLPIDLIDQIETILDQFDVEARKMMEK